MSSSMEKKPRIVFVQEENGDLKKMTEKKLRNTLRANDLSGLELCRFENETEWVPLYSLPLYKEVVPVVGDPRDAARRRVVKGLKGHVTGFAIVSAMMLITQGTLPFWLGIWGVVLAAHAFKVVPTALALKKEGKPVLSELPAQHDYKLPGARSPSARALDDEAEKIRALLDRLNPPDKTSLLAQVQTLVDTVTAAEVREADLESQTSEEETTRLQAELSEAKKNAALGGEGKAVVEQQQVFEQQIAALESRLASIDLATRAKAMLLAKKSVATHQLGQLRLDLSRADANQTVLSELATRLDDIKLEIEATHEVEALLNAGVPPDSDRAPEGSGVRVPVQEQELEQAQELEQEQPASVRR